MPHPHGLFTYVDVAVPDIDAASQFYEAVFGWKAVDLAPGYRMFMKDGKKAAGLGELSPEQQAQGMPPVWSSYVSVDSVDAIAAKVPELGGTVMVPPMDIMDQGRMTYVSDPAGAALGFWQAGVHDGAEVFNEPGALSWNELGTRDVAAAKAFYGALLPAWSLEDQEFDGGFTYTLIKLDGRDNGGIFDMSSMFPTEVPAHWGVYFAVSDTDGAVAEATRRGATLVMGPADTPFGRMASLVDPQGAAFRMITLSQTG